MTINDTRKPATVEFGSLKAGQCFIDKGDYFMALDAALSDNYNAVDLEDGILCYFYPNQDVIKINARLEVT